MEIVEAINEVSDKINRRDFSGLWIPTHLIHDCEMDDLLTWLLRASVHRAIGSSLKTLIQLPPLENDAEIDRIARKLNRAISAAADCQVFFDPSARNADAIKSAFANYE